MTCIGACSECCDPQASSRYWYGYLAEAIGYAETGCSTSVGEIRGKAMDDGAPAEVLDHISGLARTIRHCACGDICWCDVPQASDTDFERFWHEMNMPVNICDCGAVLAVADAEELNLHRHCFPGM